MASVSGYIVLLLAVVCGVQSQCPRPQDLPDKPSYQNDTFLCARMYEDYHLDPNLSCGGDFLDAGNGGAHEDPHHWSDRVSSVVVRPGCTLRMYQHEHYQGKMLTLIEGVHHDLTLKDDGKWDNRMSAFACSCIYTNVPLSCEPSEAYHVGKSCTNDMDEGAMFCKYGIQEGLSIGHSVTQGSSMTETVESTLQAAFKDVFQIGLAHSTVTSYDWSTSQDYVYEKVVTREVTCQVAPQTTVDFLEVIGRCEDSTAYTGAYTCQTRE